MKFEPSEGRQVRGASTVFSDVASVLGARGGSALLSLVSVLMSTRILGPDGYGQVAYFAVMGMLIFTVTSAWTSTAVARYGREEAEREGSMVTVTWGRILLSAPLIVAAAGLVVGMKAAGALPDAFGWTLTWLAVAFGISWVWAEHMIYSLEALGRIKWSAVGLISQQVFVVAGLTAIFFSGVGQTAVVVASLSVAASALFVVAAAVPLWRPVLWPPRFDAQLTRRVIRFSLPMIAFTASQYVIRSTDLFVLGAYETAAAVGIYALAYQGYTVLQQIATATGPVLTPLFVSLRAAGREAVVGHYLDRVVPQLTFMGAVFAGLGVAIVPLAVPLVFGSAFEQAAAPLALLFVALVLFFLSNLLAPIIVLHERTREVAVVSICAASINVVGDIALVGPLNQGVLGPAIATTAALALIAIWYQRIAADCTGGSRWSHPFVMAPLIASVAAVLLLDGLAATAAAVAVTLIAAVVVQWTTPAFAQADAALIQQLDMPRPLKRLTLRTLAMTTK